MYACVQYVQDWELRRRPQLPCIHGVHHPGDDELVIGLLVERDSLLDSGPSRRAGASYAVNHCTVSLAIEACL